MFSTRAVLCGGRRPRRRAAVSVFARLLRDSSGLYLQQVGAVVAAWTGPNALRRGCPRLRRLPKPKRFASRGVRPSLRVRPSARAEAVLHQYGLAATSAMRPSLRWARGGGGLVARPRVPMDRPEPSGGRVRAGHAGMRGRGVRRPCCSAGVPPRAWGKLGRWVGDVPSAARGGHLEVLRHVYAAGCPLDACSSMFAGHHGDVSMLRWIREQRGPWDARTCASRQGHHVQHI
jgi:hypothetical protein